MNIIGRKYIFFAFSGLLVLGSFAALAVWGLAFGIDFTGGSLLEVSYPAIRPSAKFVREQFVKAGVEDVSVQLSGERHVIARFREVDEITHQRLISGLGSLGTMQEKRFDTIGPVIGAQLKRRAMIALASALIGIVLYLTWAFRQVSRPLASWKYGTVAVAVGLFHDVIIPLGVFSLLGRFAGAEINTLFITALLTILGFSVHDTIVVFDRTRENLRNLKRVESFADTVNRSVNETITRSVTTSLTVFLVLAAIFFLGGATTKYFALTLMLGVVFGTYSSIFVASPLLVVWDAWHRGRLDKK